MKRQSSTVVAAAALLAALLGACAQSPSNAEPEQETPQTTDTQSSQTADALGSGKAWTGTPRALKRALVIANRGTAE